MDIKRHSNKKHTGLMRIAMALIYSCEGLYAAFKSETAFRQELVLFIAGTIAAFILDVSVVERALMIGSLMLILITEITNTAFESTIERISAEHHPLSKKTKDLGSASVFLALLNAIIIWLLIILG